MEGEAGRQQKAVNKFSGDSNALSKIDTHLMDLCFILYRWTTNTVLDIHQHLSDLSETVAARPLKKSHWDLNYSVFIPKSSPIELS